VSAPRKKKQGTATSGPVTAAPSPLPCVALLQPSAPSSLSAPARQMTTLACSQARPTWASQPQSSLPPPTPSSKTVVIVSPFQSRDWSAMPVVPSVRITSPDPISRPLTPIDIDYIMAVMGWQNSDWFARQCLELAMHLWNRGMVVQTFDR